MPTFKDISKLAGVSYGTVSNVLNKRGNVCLEKIKLVEQAAAELGYFINETASSLRSNKVTDVALIIPTLDDFKLRRIYGLLLKKISNLGLKLNLYITDFNPIIEEEHFKLSVATNKFIIINTCKSDSESFYNSINYNGCTLIFINTYFKINKSNIYSINFDFDQFIEDLLSHIKEREYKKVLFFTDKDLFNKRIFDIDNLKIIACSQPFNLSTSIDILSEDTFDLIVVTSPEKYESIIAAKKILQKQENMNIILISDQESSFDIKALQYNQNLNLLVEKITCIVEGSTDTDKQIFLPYSGFLGTNKPADEKSFINILMIESPSTTALLKIKPYIEEKLGFKINIDIIEYNQYDIIINEETINNYDLIRIDMAYLPEIAETIFKPLDNSFSSFTNVFIDNLQEYTHHKELMYALPFDISCILLIYRSDILNNQLIKRDYYEQTKETNIIPISYTQYNNLENFFEKNYGDIFKASTVCTGSNITCGNEFLIRVQDGPILNENSELNMENKYVVDALNSYMKSISYSKKQNMFWDNVIKEYSEGNTVMSLVYSNYIHMLKTYNKEILYKTNYTFTPSQKSLIGGGVIGLSKNTKKEDLCHMFFEILYSDEIGKLLTHLGGTMPMKSIYNDINLVFMYPWLDLLPKVLKNNTRKHYDKNRAIHQTIDYEKKIGRIIKQYISSNTN